MILVNVYVPAVEHTYDFRLNESFAPGVIVNELCEMVEQKEQLSPGNGRERLMLFDASLQRMLPFDRSLRESGIVDGHLLILV